MVRAARHYDAKFSYAQCGEDLIVDFVLKALKIRAPFYLDVGAGDPVRLSNTYLFYRRGLSGVCVEPNPELCARFRRRRPRDRCLNVGIGPADQVLPFHVLDPPTLSTFSAEEARRFAAEEGARVVRVLDVPLLPLQSLCAQHCPATPDFVSLDTEGLELEVLQSVDFQRFRPAVLCVETISYSTRGQGRKDAAVIQHMEANGYLAYGDTHVNTIFVDERRWRDRTG